MAGVDMAVCLEELLTNELGTVAVLGEMPLLVAELADVVLGPHVPCHSMTRWVANDLAIVAGGGVRWVHGGDFVGVEGSGAKGVGIPFTVSYMWGHLNPSALLLEPGHDSGADESSLYILLVLQKVLQLFGVICLQGKSEVVNVVLHCMSLFQFSLQDRFAA